MRAYGCVKQYEARNDDYQVHHHPRTGRREICKQHRHPSDRHLKKRARQAVGASVDEQTEHIDLEREERWQCGDEECVVCGILCSNGLRGARPEWGQYLANPLPEDLS